MGTAPCRQLPRAGDRGPGQKGLCAPRDSRLSVPSVPSIPSTPSAFVHGPSPSRPGVSVREHSARQSLGCALTTHRPPGGTVSALQGHASQSEQIPLPHREA